jgi:hypothetical protein
MDTSTDHHFRAGGIIASFYADDAEESYFLDMIGLDENKI